MSTAAIKEARSRGVRWTDLEGAAKRFVTDVDKMLARSDDEIRPMVTALALLVLGRQMKRGTLEMALVGGARQCVRKPKAREVRQ